MVLTKPVRWIAQFVLVLLPFVAMTPSSPAPALPTYDYAYAMHASAKPEATQPDMAHYDLTMRVDPVNKRLTGRVELWFRNATGAALSDAVLRLYPNFPKNNLGSGGNTKMTISNVVAQGKAVTPKLEAQTTAARIMLPAAVVPGEVVTLALDFETNFTVTTQDPSIRLRSYYPMLAAWENGWRTDVSVFPDKVYANSGLYHARITVPSSYSVISTGNDVGTTQASDGSTTREMVSGPVREFALSVGRFASVRAQHEGTSLIVWYERSTNLNSVAQSSLTHLKRALTTFNQRFGQYPYRAMETHLVYNTSSYNTGSEFPGLVYILTNGTYSRGTRLVLSHELAHQWYYGVLGNDIFREAWLDEGFARYIPYVVEEQWYGQTSANTYLQDTITARANRATKPAGLPIWEYTSWTDYYNAVYGKGGLFLHTLRVKVGDTAFFAALQDLYAQHKYGVISRTDLLRVMEQRSGQDLDALFVEWIGK